MRLIDADHLKRWIIARWEETDPKSAYPLRAIDIIDQVDREDTIDADPVKHGHWVKNDEGDFHCSICNAIVESDEKSRHYWRYCYHCGAKMEVKEMME